MSGQRAYAAKGEHVSNLAGCAKGDPFSLKGETIVFLWKPVKQSGTSGDVSRSNACSDVMLGRE